MPKKHKILIIVNVSLILVSILTASISAGEITVSQSLDKFEMSYESEAQFEILLKWDGPQSAYLFDKPLQPQLENLKVKQFSSTVSSEGTTGSEITRKKFTFTLAPIGSGLGKIESITISYVTWPDSVPGTLMTEGMSIRIAQPIPVKKNIPIPFIKRWYVWLGIGLLVVGSTGAFVLVRNKNRKPKKVVKTPAEEFLERIDLIKTEASGDLKRFQTGLYKHLLWYLNAKYGLVFAGQSTEEIVHEIDAFTMPEEEKGTIGAWLIRADREKFSPTLVAPGETIRLENEIREFFEKIIAH